MIAIQSKKSYDITWQQCFKIGLIVILGGTINLLPLGQAVLSAPTSKPEAYREMIDKQGKEGDMEDKNQLTEEEGRYLLQVARKTIEKALNKQEGEFEKEPSSEKYHQNRGTFVTLTKDGNLRGCIGHIIPQESLIEGVRVNAINAAFRDPRFPRLDKNEWAKIKLEISILTEPQPLSYTSSDDLLQKLRPGIDGVIIKQGYRQATFLPQVWDQLPDKKAFLTHLCLKAGLDANAWQKEKLDVSVYQVQAFEEH